MGIFNFFKTPDNLGVGVSNLALEKPQSNPIQSIYGPRYNVMNYFASTAPAYMKFNKSVPVVPIEGNGSFLQGTLALQRLTDLANEKKGATK